MTTAEPDIYRIETATPDGWERRGGTDDLESAISLARRWIGPPREARLHLRIVRVTMAEQDADGEVVWDSLPQGD